MKDELTRRAFFRCVGRWASVATLGGLVGSSVFRALRGDAGSALPALCARCPALESCTLPEGRQARLARGMIPRQELGSNASGSNLRTRPLGYSISTDPS